MADSNRGLGGLAGGNPMATTINAKTPKGAAAQLFRAIRKLDPNPDNSILRTSEHGAPQVSWEAGPYEWTIIAAGGGDIFTGDYYGGAPTFSFVEDKWFAEPQNHFEMNFYPI